MPVGGATCRVQHEQPVPSQVTSDAGIVATLWFIALDVASTSAAMYIVDCVVLALPSEPVKTNLTVDPELVDPELVDPEPVDPGGGGGGGGG